MEIILKDVRCFYGMHTIPIRPLTLLVGENSSGKTTFLAMLARLTDSSFMAMRPTFSAEPFDLGGYETIASRKTREKTTSFSVGFSVSEPASHAVKIVADYTNKSGQPALSAIEVSDSKGRAVTKFSADGVVLRYKLSGAPRERRVTGSLSTTLRSRHFPGLGASFLFGAIESVLFARRSRFRPTERHTFMDWYFQLTEKIGRALMPGYAMAPVRTKPKRTYDAISAEFEPQGAHIPLMLAQLMKQDGDGEERSKLLRALRTFGKDSGLFRSIQIKRLGRTENDPFQMMVAAGGPRANIVDVGYGVSQSLPVVVQSLQLSPNRRLLLQQPEVHLHPRAQAALGSLFSEFVAAGRKEFVIETHSDYMVDRIRMEVARKRIRPKDVSILFFHKSQGRTKVHQLELDDLGNIVNAPSLYRKFFLDEAVSLLSRPG